MRSALLLLLVPTLAACNPGPEDRADAEAPRQSPPHSVSRVESRTAAAVPPEQLFKLETLQRGHERYDIFCTPCHGLAGYGDGMAVQGGFPAPLSFHQDALRAIEPPAIVEVIANGQGLMLPMAERIAPTDRWAIAAYVKALQFSQDPPADLPASSPEPAR